MLFSERPAIELCQSASKRSTFALRTIHYSGLFLRVLAFSASVDESHLTGRAPVNVRANP